MDTLPVKPTAEAVFNRQQVLRVWDQENVRKQKLLILGVGGMGSWFAMSMARLGVGALILFDFDFVEASNLNRQILYGLSDVGRSKVEAARDSLLRQHVVHPEGTEITVYHMEALSNWETVIKLVGEATVVMNSIDVGDWWDYAVFSLCFRLKKPCCMAGTEPFYGHLGTFFIQTGLETHPCYQCVHHLDPKMKPKDASDEEDTLMKRLQPSKILTYNDVSWIPADDKPSGGSTVYSAGITALMCASGLTTRLFIDAPSKNGILPDQVTHTTIVRLLLGESVDSFAGGKEPGCKWCGKD
eukprot:Colp12_sorted_trinity150504_noHs@7459